MKGMHGIIFSYEKRTDLRELIADRIHGSIPFAGDYRVIDFVLSAMVNAGITDVGVIMHGKCQSMLDHLGSGKSWDLSRNHGGLTLLPAFAFSIYAFGLRSASVTLLCVVFCVLFEFLFEKLLHRPVTIGDLSAVVTGLILAFNLPASVPLWMPVIGAFFAIVVAKQLYGGIGKNIMNPALCARVFLTLAWPSHMALFTTPLRDRLSPLSVTLVDVTASATPLQTLKSGALPQQSLLDLFLGNMGGCLGEVSALLLLAGGVYLLIRRVITWHTPVAFLGTVAVLCYVFPRGNADRLDFMLAELLCGGLILGAVYMATDYATTPLTPMGRILFGVGCGAITVLIRYFGTYPEGVSFAILIMNTFVYYLEKATKPRKFGGRTHGKKV